MGVGVDFVCIVTLPLFHDRHSLPHLFTSAALPFNSNCDISSRQVALTPGCARLFMAVNICSLSTCGTRGQILPEEVSHRRVVP